MGGDKAPEVTIQGAKDARRELGIDVLLVGKPDVVGPVAGHEGIEAVHASEVIEMHDHPATTVRSKKDSSIVVGMRLLKEGRADAFVSAGNSGAVMAAALLVLGRARGIDRPAIGTVIPTIDGHTLMLDAGANADVRPAHLLQFARMGSVYISALSDTPAPSVGLLSNGEEETKGNALTLEAHALLRESGLNFIGNVEGRDIPRGTADIVVTDGFTGNVALKSIEGTAELLQHVLRAELTRGVRNKLAALALRGAFKRVAARLDYSEVGGAPLLGVNGAVFISHGRSNANAIKNALRVANEAARHDIVGAINKASPTD
jgi:glycerol-3-phosphate acyltransferase PlsX